MAQPTLDLDERYFEIIATSPTAIMSKHRVSGNLTVWKLDWRESGDYPEGFEQQAWEKYLNGNS